ncbi:MAG: heavy-metal-associated domain-containing protein [Chloroflexi bacterium]|nr:heavy-metal-associated domain-containing protein [Chloroflexota bacterium]
METVVLTAPTMDCEACMKSVERALGRVPGVREVHVDLTTKQVTVSFDAEDLTAETVLDSLEAAGFSVKP